MCRHSHSLISGGSLHASFNQSRGVHRRGPPAGRFRAPHGFAGPHMFISTVLIDDPNVADEASLPTFTFLPQPTDSGPVPGLYALDFEFDKRITENFGFSLNDGYQWLRTPGANTASGWENLEAGLKYKIYVNRGARIHVLSWRVPGVRAYWRQRREGRARQ